MPTLKLTIEYDGTNYVGWQRQATGLSIQGLLEDALAPIEGTPVTVHGAGRTDAGVHATGQVASARLTRQLSESTLARAVNAVLPQDVRVVAVEAAADTFHAQFSARAKTYEYRIVNAPCVSAFLHRYVWHVPQPLNLTAMRSAAAALIGRHDFAAFQGAGSNVATTVRTILTLELEDGGGFAQPIVLRITGDGFLRHMVRTIAGTLVEVGVGRWQASRLQAILEARDRACAGPTAPPHGLFLTHVAY